MSLSNIETIIASLGELYYERHSVRVPFRFGLAELNAWANKGGPNYFWVPTRSTIEKDTEKRPGLRGRSVNAPSYDKHESFQVLVHAANRGDAEALHCNLVMTLVVCPGQFLLGGYEWETEREDFQAPNVNGATIVQEVTIITEIPDLVEARGITFWTVAGTQASTYVGDEFPPE